MNAQISTLRKKNQMNFDGPVDIVKLMYKGNQMSSESNPPDKVPLTGAVLKKEFSRREVRLSKLIIDLQRIVPTSLATIIGAYTRCVSHSVIPVEYPVTYRPNVHHPYRCAISGSSNVLTHYINTSIEQLRLLRSVKEIRSDDIFFLLDVPLSVKDQVYNLNQVNQAT